MKKVFTLSILLALVIPAGLASAATIIVQNYFYVHENKPGTYYFKDKYGSEIQYGDNVQHDAVIQGLYVSAQGLAAGDQIVVYTGSGSSYPVTPGVQMNLSVPKNDYIKIALIKTGTNEVFAKLDDMNTFDDSDGGTYVHYIYSVNDIPTKYGDLGQGGDTSNIINGTYYYFPPKDKYKFDYPPPSGVSYYELHFDGAAGHFYRTYNQQPTGVHYLTCNGIYVMKFFDASGNLVAKTPEMTTHEIQVPTCNSQPENTGYKDFTLTKSSMGNGKATLNWNSLPNAVVYQVFRKGQLIEAVDGTSAVIDDDGEAYSVIAFDQYSNLIGQADLPASPTQTNPPPGGGDGGEGCDGCKWLTDILACPAWDQYMGEWESMLRDVIPPPPDWQEVANIMRDTIVPAMGQELVNRAPEIAEIIADEFESREDPVNPPGPLPSYTPPYPVPTMQDMTERINFDLTTDVPSFEPDYSGSKPFTIPDPLNIQLDDTDAGYTAPDPTPSNNPIPVYSGGDPTPEPDPGYAGSSPPVDETAIPGYVVTNPDATAPERSYNPPSPDTGGTIPSYQAPPPDSGTIPGYQLPNDPMPSYKNP